jgi:tetratricopeptide (TPR) repeat protein
MQTTAFFIVLVIAIPGALASFKRNKVWESNAALFTADVDHAPHSARVHFNHGTILMAQLPENVQDQQPYLPEIISCFKRALQIDSLDKGSHVNLGVCYYRTADYAQSVSHTRSALRIEPNDTSLWGNLADAYFKLNQFDSAVVYYKRVLPGRYAVVRHYNTIGNAYFQLKQYKEAIAAFEGGLKRFGENDTELLMNLGNACGAAGDFRKAQATFLKLTQLQPENPRYWEMLSMVSQNMGDTQKAIEYAQIAMSKKQGRKL